MRKLGMDRFIPRLAFVLQPNDEQFNSMLAELAGVMGWRGVASVLGISIRTLDSWRKGENGPSAGARKLVWLVWTLVFHPEKLRSLFDVATWGKFVVASNGGVGGGAISFL